MALPTLTQVLGGVTSTGSVTPTDQEVLDALSTALAAATYWEEKSSGTGYVEFGPKSGSAISSFRGLLVGNDSAPTNRLAPDTATNGTGCWIGIAPDGGTFSGTWDSSNPYTSARWSGYWQVGKQGVTENLWLIESDETLAIVFRDDSTDSLWTCIVGAIIEAPDTGSGDNGSDERVYGMITGGWYPNSITFHTATNGLLDHTEPNNRGHMGIFTPAVGGGFIKINRFYGNTTSSTTRLNVSYASTLVNLPMFYITSASPYFHVGKLRQIYFTQEYIDRTTVVDSGAATKGYILGSHPSTAYDAILFGNG